MNKAALLPLVCELVVPLFRNAGYRYLKTEEKYQKRSNDVRVWCDLDISYWVTSDYCLFSPRMSVHVDAVADAIAQYEARKADRHAPTVTILSDRLAGAKWWTMMTDVAEIGKIDVDL